LHLRLAADLAVGGQLAEGGGASLGQGAGPCPTSIGSAFLQMLGDAFAGLARGGVEFFRSCGCHILVVVVLSISGEFRGGAENILFPGNKKVRFLKIFKNHE
jgi:hypothetical protein